MPYGLYMSAAGANAQTHRLEVLSHNLANVNTPGFKYQETVVQARPAEQIERGEAQAGTGEIEDVGGGVTLQTTQTRFDLGAVKQTGVQTDFALQNQNDFFVVEHQGRQMLTRDQFNGIQRRHPLAARNLQQALTKHIASRNDPNREQPELLNEANTDHREIVLP